MNNIDQLFKQIKAAMSSNPDLSLLELIDSVCNRTFATRNYDHNMFDERQKWQLSNNDILKAFESYNKTKLL